MISPDFHHHDSYFVPNEIFLSSFKVKINMVALLSKGDPRPSPVVGYGQPIIPDQSASYFSSWFPSSFPRSRARRSAFTNRQDFPTFRAIDKTPEAHAAKGAALQDAQDLADILLDAEAKLGGCWRLSPKKSEFRSGNPLTPPRHHEKGISPGADGCPEPSDGGAG